MAANLQQLLAELERLVHDELRVVSYKWLSRAFSLPSDIAKQVLYKFAESHKGRVEATYLVAGWTKEEPTSQALQLTSSGKLEECKAAMAEVTSVHVYSVQQALPKDAAALWSAEFIQAEELFNKARRVDNCLWDNRFSGVASSEARPAHAAGTAAAGSLQASPALEVTKPACAMQAELEEKPESVALQRPTNVAPEADGLVDGAERNAARPSAKRTAPQGRKRPQGTTNGGGASLASLWGKQLPSRAVVAADTDTLAGQPGDAQEHDHPRRALQPVNSDRAFDSDVGVLSGKPPVSAKVLSPSCSGPPADEGGHMAELAVDSQDNVSPPDVLQEVNVQASGQSEAKVADATGTFKRRKVLQTVMDERGREVTRMVWEGENGKECPTSPNSSPPEPLRGPVPLKPSHDAPAAKPLAKPAAAGKVTPKGATKSGKAAQKGNIMNFFKKG
eukprot:SM000007S20920  [mRNA]  locus=s7:946100:948422:+ [translate_table: standard]